MSSVIPKVSYIKLSAQSSRTFGAHLLPFRSAFTKSKLIYIVCYCFFVLKVLKSQLSFQHFLINRYSNEGDTVLDFFGGIMTVPYVAVNMNRYGIGIELNSDYFRDGVGYLKSADLQKDAPTLFDFMEDSV